MVWRAAGLAVVAAILMAAMVVLGVWQLDVYRDHQHGAAVEALHRTPVPLDSVLGPDAAFPSDGVGRPVTVTGTYTPGRQFWVRGLSGAEGRYTTVTPLVTSSGSAVLVVRGSADHRVHATPSGVVTVQGYLEPSQSHGGPPGQDRTTTGIEIPRLVRWVPQDLYSGYVIVQPGQVTTPGLTAVSPPLPEPSRWAGVRNFLYAVQWWVFAAFVAFMWWKIVHAEDRRRRT